MRLLDVTGWLDGRRATTHWKHTAALARSYPQVTVEPDTTYVADGPVTTSAGVSAGIDLALAVVADPAGDHSLPAIAGRAGVSTRQLTRLFRRHVAATPAAYVESVRVEAAQALLAAGGTVAMAARRSGMGSDESLRRVFLRRLGTSPSAYRARFRSDTP